MIALLHRKEKMQILKTELFKIEIGFINNCVFLVPLKVMEQWECQWWESNHSDLGQTHNE